jgi:YegS/Rv2252/BmrU family lipid kinase
MSENKEWVFIINPIAGNGYASLIVDKLKEMLLKYKVEAELVFTERKGHALELSEQYAGKGFKYIIGVGGDGTFNEIATPLVNRPDFVTGLIAAGTGNDFIQILGFPGRFEEKDWDMFFKRDIIRMDVGDCNGKVFMNGMGLGFDAQVAAENYTGPGEVKRGGKNKYIWHILKTLLFFKEKRMTVISEGRKSESDCFINTISIGRRFAGGFFLTPNAIANDGLLDVCSIKRLTLPQRLKILLMVPKGTHINDLKVNYYQTDKLSLEFPVEVPYHIDGELYFSKKI